MRKNLLLLTLLSCLVICSVSPAEESKGLSKFGDSFVEGEVVSYSYVPNRHWTLEQAKGILPYLCEYELMAWSGDKPLEAFHEENIRRIDLASQWSTAIMF